MHPEPQGDQAESCQGRYRRKGDRPAGGNVLLPRGGITVGAIQIETHDRRYLQPSLGIKTLQSIEKYQVDVLGNYQKVDLPEKRMTFSKEG